MTHPQHPPLANQRACVDFDGTIVPWGPLMATKDPFPGTAIAMQELRSRGFRITILTSRASPRWWASEASRRGVDIEDFGATQLAYVKKLLDRAEVPFDEITAEKVPAEVYFDDKAIRVTHDYTLADAIGDFLETTNGR